MYSLDVNFLKDRPEYSGQREKSTQTSRPAGSMTPLYVGIAIGLLLPGLVGGFWLFLQQQNAQLDQKKAELNNQLGSLKTAEQQIAQLNKEIGNVRSETQALASVFEQIKPWSAMLQDIRERVPPNVEIATIEQKQVVPTNAPAAGAAPAKPGTPPPKPSPATRLEIKGTARTFDDVNYWLLTLQRSQFLKLNETQLIKAELQDNSPRLEISYPQTQNQAGGRVTYQLPKRVGYTIQATLNDVPASDLIRELDRKGAVGLVTRIRTLQEKGVNQK